jgi:hypothetical protein
LYGQDSSVRSKFNEEGGFGIKRDVSTKRGCANLDHFITWEHDLNPLIDQFEMLHNKGDRIVHKQRKALNFMKTCYDVEPVGTPPRYRATLYKMQNEHTVLSVSVRFAFGGFEINVC